MATQAAFDAFSQTGAGSATQIEEARTLLRMTEAAKIAGTVTAAEEETCLQNLVTNIFLRPGKRVEIYGLSARPDLNGCCGVIAGDLHEGRIAVEVQSTHVRLRPCNMRPAPAEVEWQPLSDLPDLPGLTPTVPPQPSDAAQPTTPQVALSHPNVHEPGSLVEVSGLASASASTFNGQIGEVLPGADDERVPVRLHANGARKSLRIKPANLIPPTAERCLADGSAALRDGRPRDALARADCALELDGSSAACNLLRVRAVLEAGRTEPRVCQAKTLADAALVMVSNSGLRAVPADVCVATSYAKRGDGKGERIPLACRAVTDAGGGASPSAPVPSTTA